jgi:hypothetical protein
MVREISLLARYGRYHMGMPRYIHRPLSNSYSYYQITV